MSKDVFISYSNQDKSTAEMLCAKLESRGLSCWIAPRDITPGADFDESILEGIDESNSFVLILSNTSNNSRFVQSEVNRAFSKGKSIFTFRINDVIPSRQLELYLARQQWLDGFPHPIQKKIDRLASSISSLLGLDKAGDTNFKSENTEKQGISTPSNNQKTIVNQLFIEMNHTEFILVDIDKNKYKAVKIGSQLWMAENLKVKHYRNGDEIPKVIDIYGCTDLKGLKTDAYCIYDNDESNADTFGCLYNWYTVADKRNLAPEGWHVPTDEDWKTLEMHLGMSQSDVDTEGYRSSLVGCRLAGNYDLWKNGRLKLKDYSEFNKSGFTALPGGYLGNDGIRFWHRGEEACFWSATEYTSEHAWARELGSHHSGVNHKYSQKIHGFSVRLVRD